MGLLEMPPRYASQSGKGLQLLGLQLAAAAASRALCAATFTTLCMTAATYARAGGGPV